jgi:hypothetical protein
MGASYTDYLQWLAQQERMMPQNMQQNTPMMQPILSYVANRTAADLFNVNPGQAAILIDMDMPMVYKKSRGADGKLIPLEVYDLVPHKEVVEPVQTVNLDGYVKYADIDRIVAEEVDRRITEAFSKPSKKKQQPVAEED